MIIELAGLPGSGKTRLANELADRGAYVARPTGRIRILTLVLLFEILHPFRACRIAYIVLRHAPRGMRYTLFVNGYMLSAAKWTQASWYSRKGRVVVIDQGHAQIPLMLGVIPESFPRLIPKPDILAIVDAPAETRIERMQSRGRMPREEYGTSMAKIWDEAATRVLAQARPLFEKHYPQVVSIDGTRSVYENASLLLSSYHPRITAPLSKQLMLFVSLVLSLGRTPRGAAVLMYHAVDNSGWRLSVPPGEFERQIKYLTNHRVVVKLEDIVAYAMGSKDLPRKAVAITFDDGYHDLVENVLPVITKHQVPITVFLTTDLSEETAHHGLPRLTAEDISILQRSGLVTFESHGHSHAHMSRLTLDEIKSDLKRAEEELSKYNIKPTHFAYPYGDRSPDVEKTVKDLGYRAAFSITEGFVRSGDNLHQLRRIQVDSTTSSWLSNARLTSALEINRRIVDFFRRYSA